MGVYFCSINKNPFLNSHFSYVPGNACSTRARPIMPYKEELEETLSEIPGLSKGALKDLEGAFEDLPADISEDVYAVLYQLVKSDVTSRLLHTASVQELNDNWTIDIVIAHISNSVLDALLAHYKKGRDEN